MSDDKPQGSIRGYVSHYLRQPLRSLHEVLQRQQQETHQPDSHAGEERHQPKG